MGGTIFLGIREPDGTEYLMETWTNAMPWRTADLDFLRLGKTYKDLIERAKDPGESIYTRMVKYIRNPEYGYVLFDFKDRAIFSANDYYSPGGWILWAISDGDARAFLALVREGLVTSVRTLNSSKFDDTTDDPQARARAIATCERIASGPPSGPFVAAKSHETWAIKYKPLDLVVTNLSNDLPDKRVRAALNSFLDDHGWHSTTGPRRRKRK